MTIPLRKVISMLHELGLENVTFDDMDGGCIVLYTSAKLDDNDCLVPVDLEDMFEFDDDPE